MEYRQMLEILKHNGHIEKNKYGQEIVVKDVPEEGYADDFDPRVLVNATKPFPFPGEGKPSIEFIRSIMGWDNDDVTSGTVSREEAYIPMTDGSVSVLIYGKDQNKKKPCIIFFHGGGFIGGTLKCVENPCKALSMYADAVVVSVDYALAPEHPFPQGFNECFETVRYVFENPDVFCVDKDKIAVCGDSAGGNLAAVCAVRDRDERCGMIRFQALIYPAVNVLNLPNEEYVWAEEEYEIQKHKDLLLRAVNAIGGDGSMMIQNYLGGDASLGKKPYVSPIFADAAGLPPALIINAEYDFLRIEGEAYGRKLKKAGIPSVNIRYRGVDHAFIDKIGQYPQAEDCMREIAVRFLETVK